MIVPDLNLLIYAYNSAAPLHDPARRWWNGLMDGAEDVGIPWLVTVGFVRITTNRAALRQPLDPAHAASIVREWFTLPHVAPLNPGPRHLDLFHQVLTDADAGGNRANDAHIAALAIEREAEVHSNDSDFGRFPGLRWRNPLDP